MAADIDVAAGAIEQQGDDAVHHDAGTGDPHHQAGMHRLRVLHASEGLIKDEERDDDQRAGVDQGGQYSGPVVAVGFRRAGRARLQVDRDQRKQQGEKVGKIVPGLGQQREGMRSDASHDQQSDVSERDEQGDPEHLRGARARAGMHVHLHPFKCNGGRVGLQGAENLRRVILPSGCVYLHRRMDDAKFHP